MNIPILGMPVFAPGDVVQHRNGTLMGVVYSGPEGLVCRVVQDMRVSPNDVRLWEPSAEEKKALEAQFGPVLPPVKKLVTQ